MKDWRSSPSADAEGASFNKTNLSGKRTVFFDSFAWKIHAFNVDFCVQQRKNPSFGSFRCFVF